jgi:FeS assembly SUF system protein
MPERLPEAKGETGLDPIRRSILEAEVIDQIRTVYDPEIPVNVFDLGLIYAVDVREDASVDIKMTLTSPACPVAGTLPGEVEAAARQAPGVGEVRLELVWDPPFTVDRIPEPIRLELGLL